MKLIVFITILLPFCKSVSDWRPVLHPEIYPGLKHHYALQTTFQSPSLPSLVAQSYQPSSPHVSDQCGLYKVGFTQDLYFQYIQYKTNLPELKEFSLCYWSKFTNHSNDHPIFSYAAEGQPKAISSFVSNTDRSSYFTLSVDGHTFYRLNYPLRLNRWYHTCQSWNGRTGEWQIWVNAERVGRGFHNRLVGHVIPAGGIAITGQEQTQYGGGFLEGLDAPKGSGGMLGEVTMIQLYKVALTAGKAHRDHKHHHAHSFDHYGNPITTTPRPPPRPRPMTPTHPLLTGGQLNPNVALTIASGQTQQQPLQPQQLQPQELQPQLTLGQSFEELFNTPFASNLFTQQLIGSGQPPRGPQQFLQTDSSTRTPQSPRPPQQQQYFLLPQSQLPEPRNPSLVTGGLVHPSLINPANVQIIDNTDNSRQLFKRDGENTKNKRSAEPDSSTDGKIHSKRELFLAGGTLYDDSLLRGGFDQSLLNGLAGVGQNEPILQQQKQYDEREPAEAEVKAVMNLCTGCDEEPFGKALVFGWRNVPKKLYSGAFYTPAVPQCKAF